MLQEFIDFVKEHSQDIDTSSIFTMNALSGEIGELANVYKKEKYAEMFKEYALERKKANKTFREDKVDEAGDVLFYFIELLNRDGISIEEVVKYHINKVNNYSKELGRKFLK